MKLLPLILLSLFSLFSLPPAPQVTHQLVFVGDSLTEGAFAADAAHSYPRLVAAATGLSEQVQSQYGVTAVFTAAKMRSISPKRRAVPGDALYVVVELGTNDVVASGETLAQFAAAYAYILARTHHDAPHARLVCLGTWRDPTTVASSYNTVIATACSSYGGSYVALGDLYLTGSLHGPAGVLTAFGVSDWFHPNNAGHAAIAARVAAVV